MTITVNDLGPAFTMARVRSPLQLSFLPSNQTLHPSRTQSTFSYFKKLFHFSHSRFCFLHLTSDKLKIPKIDISFDFRLFSISICAVNTGFILSHIHYEFFPEFSFEHVENSFDNPHFFSGRLLILFYSRNFSLQFMEAHLTSLV